MKIGYARTSTLDQHLDLQLDALTNCGCEKIFQEKISSVKDKRPQLENCLQALRNGDTLYIWRLDRLGRSLKDLITIVNQLQEIGCELVSIKESIDRGQHRIRIILYGRYICLILCVCYLITF